jgi:hemolysin D
MKPSNVQPLRPWARLQPALGLGDAHPYHETDFLPAALEVIERPASPAARMVALSICSFVTLAIIWASVGTVDIIASAPGSVLPIGNSKLIQPLETGVVRSIKVADGQHVQAGQVLVELDAVGASSDRDKAAGDLVKAQLEVSRLEGLRRFIAGGRPDLVDPPVGAAKDEIEAAQASARAQAAEEQAKLAGLEKQIVGKAAEAAQASETIDKLTASLPVAEQQEAVRRQLKDQGYGSTFDWMSAKEHLIEEQHGLPTAQQQRDEALAESDSLKRQIEQTRAEFEKSVLSDLAAAQQKQDELTQETGKDTDRVSFMTLKAPIAGTVQQLAVHTVGGVVTPAQQLMVVAPDTSVGLVVEARIQNKDVGFVRAGQEAQIKVEAFTFTRYGLINGRVLDVSRDAIASDPQSGQKPAASDDASSQDKDSSKEPPDSAGYVAHVALDRDVMMTENGPVMLGPGMKVTAEIKTGKRTVISYLLSPVVRYRQESLRER